MPAEASADVTRLAEALRRTATQADITTHDVLVQSANQILAGMEAKVPVKTGKLRSSLTIQVRTDPVIIGPNPLAAPYAAYVEYGTRPHEIRPRNPHGVLKFRVGGTWVYAKKVNHPGTQAQPYVLPAFMDWVD